MTPKRIDANQPAIVRELRQLGATVLHLHTLGKGCPDILVGHKGKLFLFEIKGPKGLLTAEQACWHTLWRGQVAVIRSIEDAMAVMGIETC